jgi:hypothetical protein
LTIIDGDWNIISVFKSAAGVAFLMADGPYPTQKGIPRDEKAIA